MLKRHRLVFVLFALFLLSPQRSHSQTTVPVTGTASGDAATVPSPTPSPSPTPVPLAEVATQAEATLADLRDVEADFTADPLLRSVNAELPLLAREIQARLNESARVQTVSPSLETLRTLRIGWQHIRETLSDWKRDLTRRATRLDEDIVNLGERAALWEQTRTQAVEVDAPPEVRQRIEAVIAAVEATQKRAEARRSQILTLQNRVGEQDVRVNNALTSLRQAQDAAVNQLVTRSGPPLWSAFGSEGSGETLTQAGQESFSEQATALQTYAIRKSLTLFLHLCAGVVLASFLYRARQRMRAWTVEDPGFQRTALVFETPIAAALLLTLLLSGQMYPQAPRLWWALIGASALIPTVIVLRRQLEAHLSPVLYALVGFYLVDQLRAVTATLPLVSRLLFMAEMLGGIAFLLWLLHPGRFRAVPNQDRNRLWEVLRVAARIAMGIFGVALAANTLGYISLSTLLGDGILGSAYFALIVYALFRIVDGLIFSGLRLLSRFGFVQRHSAAIRRYLHQGIKALSVLVWTLYTLEMFAIRTPLMERIHAALAAGVTLGSITFSLGNVLAFVFTVWAAFAVSRLVRFLLEEDVYPRFNLARGLPYAISTMLHYVILVLGFLLATAALGVDMTKFTILAGAFGVGLGFGMQNIVNNFVSGLILLFERPIKIGDVIETADATGVVERIGIRASVIRTTSGAEVIVPNGKFISDRVTNWTFTNNLREIALPVKVTSDSDPDKVLGLLVEMAEAHPDIIREPAPHALLLGFGAAALELELRASTVRVEEWQQVRSELALAIRARLASEGITMA